MTWAQEKIGNLCTVGRGSSPRPIADQKYFDGGTIPWVKIADATASTRYIYKTKQCVNDYGASFSRKLSPGSIILAASGTLGFPMYLGVEACIHDGWLYFDEFNNEKIDKGFFFYKLETLRPYFEQLSYGAAIQNVNTGILRNTVIEIPSLEIQRKITRIICAYDDLIENNSKRIVLLEEIAQITYEEWFVRLRFPDHESTAINTKTGLPEGWESIKCYDAMEVMSGGTPKTSVEAYWNGTIPFYTPKDAVDSSYVFETEKYVTELGVSKCNSKLYPKDTVFITARGTVGKVNLAGLPMAMNQSCYALAGKGAVSPYFLFFAVKDAVEAFKGASNGGVFNTIVVDTFRYLSFTKPTQELIRRFEDFVSPILAEVSNLTIQNQYLREARNILLPRLITGAIDVESYDPAQLLKGAA
jgi:type I restriction enzyme, S subunit